MLSAQLTQTHQSFSSHPQVRQGEQRGQLGRVFHQPTKAYFHVTKLALDNPKRMLNLGACLRFAVLDLALGFVQQAAFVQLGIRAAPSRDLPDHVTIFVLFTLLDTGVTCVRIDRVFVPVEQFSDLGDIGHIGSGAMDVMNQSRLNVSADVGLHTEEILVTLLGLMHLGIALAVFVLGRAWGMNNGRVDDGALAQ